MKFAPKTETEVQEAGLQPAGDYDFEVAEASDEVSKKDNEMIKLKLRVYSDNGGYFTVFDYLLESIPYKLRHFAYATGVSPAYEAGTLLARDCDQRTGRCKIAIQPAKDGYPAKNIVRDYLPEEKQNGAAAPKPTTKPAPELVDDEIPF